MEENTKKKLEFSLGVFDNLTDRIKTRIEEESSRCETYAVGVYTDKFVIEKLMTYPSKTLEERSQIAKSIEGVDFTFPVDTSDSNKVKEIIEKAYATYLQSKNN